MKYMMVAIFGAILDAVLDVSFPAVIQNVLTDSFFFFHLRLSPTKIHRKVKGGI